jgi:hypothetical protein
MQRPDDINLSREEGEALIERLETHTCTAEDLRVVAQVVRLYFWLLFALKESKLSLERFRVMLFGEKSKPPKPPPTEAPSGSEGRGQSDGGAGSSSHDAQESDDGRGATSEPTGESPSEQEGGDETQTDDTEPRPGHGRLSIETYSASERVACRHQDLAPSDRCPVCGIGWLYSLPPGRDLRINGHELLSAIRYDVETLRCSACGECFTDRPAFKSLFSLYNLSIL